MKAFLLLSIMMTFIPSMIFAGSTGGGFPGLQLEAMALSEKVISVAEMREVIGGKDVGVSTERKKFGTSSLSGLSSARMMESSVDQSAGVLIEVKASDFAEIAADAANGKDFIYRDIAVRVTESDTENEIVTMSPIEDSSVTILVKTAEGTSL